MAQGYLRGHHGLQTEDVADWMHSQQREADGVAPTAIDVHNHAMPLPLLEWLQGDGLADLSRFRDGVVLLDPVVSGVGKNTPLPLARSQYDAVTRLSEMDDVGVSAHAVSMPPFLYCSNSEDAGLVTAVIARGNDELAGYVADGANRLYGLGSVPLGFPDAADEARRCLDELGFPGVAIGTRGGGKELDDPVNEDLWAQPCWQSATRLSSCTRVVSPTRTDSATSISRSSSVTRPRQRSASLG